MCLLLTLGRSGRLHQGWPSLVRTSTLPVRRAPPVTRIAARNLNFLVSFLFFMHPALIIFCLSFYLLLIQFDCSCCRPADGRAYHCYPPPLSLFSPVCSDRKMRRIFTYSCLCPQCLYHDVIRNIAAAATRVNIINHGGDVVIVHPAAQCHLIGNMFKFTLI